MFVSRINTTGREFSDNRQKMLALFALLRSLEDRARRVGAVRSAFAARGQLLPRQRLALLLDSGALFLEIANMPGGRHVERNPRLEIFLVSTR